jgi:hypothetical protein
MEQGWLTYGTQEDFLGTRHSLLLQFFLPPALLFFFL